MRNNTNCFHIFGSRYNTYANMKTISRLYQQWQSLQPLTEENRARLDRKFNLEFNYNSNHLEGNTLTYGQTELLLMFGETSGDFPYMVDSSHSFGMTEGSPAVRRVRLDR